MKRLFSHPDFTFLALSGLLAGFANGLLGAGGGIIVTFALTRAYTHRDADTRDIFANVVAAMLPMTAVSAVIYALRGRLDMDAASPYLLPAILGGIIGALLLGRINTEWLKKIFALLVVVSGVRMLM